VLIMERKLFVWPVRKDRTHRRKVCIREAVAVCDLASGSPGFDGDQAQKFRAAKISLLSGHGFGRNTGVKMLRAKTEWPYFCTADTADTIRCGVFIMPGRKLHGTWKVRAQGAERLGLAFVHG
jgi:hypothetical protein